MLFHPRMLRDPTYTYDVSADGQRILAIVPRNASSGLTLSSGDSLGPYEIVAPLGAGGMGEVYKARATRLNRFGFIPL